MSLERTAEELEALDQQQELEAKKTKLEALSILGKISNARKEALEVGVDQRTLEEKFKGSDEKREKEIRDKFVRAPRDGSFELANYLAEKFSVVSIGKTQRETFAYKDGYYVRAENQILLPEIQRVLQNLTTKNAKTETMHKIIDRSMCRDDIFEVSNRGPFLDLVNLKNGVYDLKNNILLPHDPIYLFSFQFPIIYNPDADCPKTKKFFEQVLTPDQQTIIEEWLGYYFLRDYRFKKAIIFVGEGGTGKTTLIEIVHSLLGSENISAVPLQKMTTDKFSAAHLYKKHGNLVDELSAKDIHDTDAFKKATGDSSLMGEFKFGNQFVFHNFSKFTFACNRIPDVKDFADDAYFNRWIVIKFNKPIQDKIPNFIEQLRTQEELSGLFNLAIKGLRRLIENKNFSYKKDAIDIKREMMSSGSSIAQFCESQLVFQVGAEISKNRLHAAYSDFCARNEMGAEEIKSFGKRLTMYVPYVTEGQIPDEHSPTKYIRGWRNVGIKPTEEEIKLDEQFNES